MQTVRQMAGERLRIPLLQWWENVNDAFVRYGSSADSLVNATFSVGSASKM